MDCVYWTWRRKIWGCTWLWKVRRRIWRVLSSRFWKHCCSSLGFGQSLTLIAYQSSILISNNGTLYNLSIVKTISPFGLKSSYWGFILNVLIYVMIATILNVVILNVILMLPLGSILNVIMLLYWSCIFKLCRMVKFSPNK